MITIMDRYRVHVLRQEGLTKAAIADRIGCCEKTVYTILRESEPSGAELGAGEAPRPRRPGPAGKAEPFAERIQSELEQTPDLPTVELFRRSRAWGYAGAKSAFYALVRRLRPAPVKEPMVCFDGLPGEFAQFDFGGHTVTYEDGSSERLHFFCGRLKFSRFLHVELTPDEKSESVIRGTVSCLDAFDGAPKQWVYDNPKTVWVDKPGGGRELHADLRELMADCRALIEPCAPYRANQKGSVENLVRFFKDNFLRVRHFRDRADLERQLHEWLHEVNFVRPCSATGVPPAERLAEELPRLRERALGETATTYPLRRSVTVLPTGIVRFLGTGYSVDPKRLGAPATLLVRRHGLEIIVGDSRCRHTRDDRSGRIYRLPEHSLAQVGAIQGRRKKIYAQRQYLMDLGPGSRTFLDRLIMSCPGNSWYRDLQRLYEVCIAHDPQAVEVALGACHAAGDHFVAAVAAHLSSGRVVG